LMADWAGVVNSEAKTINMTTTYRRLTIKKW
jgi:hypothetical protein